MKESQQIKPPELERKLLDAMTEADAVIMDTMFSFEEYLRAYDVGACISRICGQAL